MANHGGFSWKRASGLSGAKSKVARSTGIPTTAQGRKRKAQAALWDATIPGGSENKAAIAAGVYAGSRRKKAEESDYNFSFMGYVRLFSFVFGLIGLVLDRRISIVMFAVFVLACILPPLFRRRLARITAENQAVAEYEARLRAERARREMEESDE